MTGIIGLFDGLTGDSHNWFVILMYCLIVGPLPVGWLVPGCLMAADTDDRGTVLVQCCILCMQIESEANEIEMKYTM